jgi:hypothetical protein
LPEVHEPERGFAEAPRVEKQLSPLLAVDPPLSKNLPGPML